MITSVQAFFKEAMDALHVTEFTSRIPQLDIWLLGIAAFLALLCCLFGYRLRGLWFAGLCGIFGFVIGSWVYSQGILDINFSTALALLAAALFVFTYKLSPATLTYTAIFLSLFCCAKLELLTAVIPSAVLAIAAMFLARWILTCLTAFFGSAALLNLLIVLSPQITALLPKAETALSSLAQVGKVYYICLSVLTVIGFFSQARLAGNDPLFYIRRRA